MLLGENLAASDGGATVDYAGVRRALLKAHGPVQPCAYYMDRLHAIQVDTVADARKELQRLVQLYNRAAGDCETPGATAGGPSLCVRPGYPGASAQFCNAPLTFGGGVP